MVRLSALAVLRLMTNSNVVGCSTGRSAGVERSCGPRLSRRCRAFGNRGCFGPAGPRCNTPPGRQRLDSRCRWCASCQGGNIMGFETIAITAVVGLLAGWLAGSVMKGGGHGLVGDLTLGVVGGVLGGVVLWMQGTAVVA